MAINDDLPDGYVLHSQDALPDGYVIQSGGNDASGSGQFVSNLTHDVGRGYGDLLRGAVSAPLAITDLAARIPTWGYNTFRPDSLPKIDYPPSLSALANEGLDKLGLPQPQNTLEKYQSAAVRNWPFGAGGMMAGMAAQGINDAPIGGDKNITIGDRDIGISPKDIASNVVGALAMGALSPKPAMMKGIANSEEGRLAQINESQGIPTYLSDVAEPESTTGKVLNFLNNTPMSGSGARGAEQQAALNEAAITPMGATGNILSPKVMGETADRLGKVYSDFGKTYDVSPQAGSQMVGEIGNLQTSWKKLPESTQSQLNAYVDQDVLPALDNNYAMGGEKWSKLQSSIGRDARRTTDPQLESALYDLQSTIRDGMRKSVSPQDYGKFDAANSQYRAMLALESANKAGLGKGNVSPQALLQGVNKIYPDTLYNDPNALPQLSQSSQLLKNAQKNADKMQMNLHRSPLEVGQWASIAATPFGALFNRTLNTKIEPMDWNRPYTAAFSRALQGGAVPFGLAPQQER